MSEIVPQNAPLKQCVQHSQSIREQATGLKKKCNKCLEWLPATTNYFHKDPSTLYRLKNTCKVCRGFKYTPGDARECLDSERRCTKCLQVFPATEAYFYKDPRNGLGLTTACKRCRGGGRCRTFGVVRVNCGEGERQCTKCLKVFPETSEHFDRKGHQGEYASECKTCKHERYIAHRNETLEKARIDRQSNPEKFSQYERRRAAYKRTQRAEYKAVPGTCTDTQITNLLKRQHYRCYYAACGYAKFEKKDGKYVYHVEHTFPLSRVVGTDIPANSIDYLVLACPSCNLSKHNKFPWEWVEGGRLL